MSANIISTESLFKFQLKSASIPCLSLMCRIRHLLTGTSRTALVLSVSILAFTPFSATASALSDVAAGMSVGEWRELNTDNFGNGAIFVTDDGGVVMDYTDEALWDPVHRQIYIIGTARGDSASYGMINQKWIVYRESDNSWAEMPKPSFYIGYHSYDHAALYTPTGDYYVKIVGDDAATDREVRKYTASTGTWSTLPPMPVSRDAPCCGGFEYFPELGGMVYVNPRDNGGEFYLYDPIENDWSVIPGGFSGNYSQFTEYNQVQKILYFGGGATYPRRLYKLDSSKNVIRLTDAPVSLGTDSDSGSAVQTVDPISGNLVVFSYDNRTFEYNPGSNTWLESVAHPLPRLMAVAVPLYDYGVIFVAANIGNGEGKVYLYKHTAGTPVPPDTVPPSPPQNVNAE